jgi:hypothetical protein
MKNFLVESGTASQAFGAASMKKAKPITALYQTKFSRGGRENRDAHSHPDCRQTNSPALCHFEPRLVSSQNVGSTRGGALL